MLFDFAQDFSDSYKNLALKIKAYERKVSSRDD